MYSQSVDVDRRSSTILLPAVLALLLVFIFSLPASSRFSYASITGIHELADLSPRFYPRGLIAEVRKRGSNHRIFNYFNWGGAFIWALYPQERVFIDQRNDCYPTSVFMDYFAVHELDRDWKAVLETWRIDHVAYPKKTMLAEKLRTEPEWKLVYEDDQAVLFERRTTDLSTEATAEASDP